MAPIPEQYVSHKESLCAKEYCFTALTLIKHWQKVYKNSLVCWASWLPIWILDSQTTLQWTISEYPQKIVLKNMATPDSECRVNQEAGRSSWLLPIRKEVLRGLSILDSKYYKPMWMTALEGCGNNVKVCFQHIQRFLNRRFIFW